MKTFTMLVGYANLGAALYFAAHSNYAPATFYLLWYVILTYLGDKE
jgi:hypothetical protein